MMYDSISPSAMTLPDESRKVFLRKTVPFGTSEPVKLWTGKEGLTRDIEKNFRKKLFFYFVDFMRED